MKIKSITLTSLLLAMGFILHSIVPGFFGMKFDIFLSFLFLAIVICPTIENAVLAGISGGIITALTTTFPAGQIPNVIDKIITALFVLMLVKLFQNIKNNSMKMAMIGFFGTLVSGSVFLTSALFLAGLPAPLSVLFVSVVLPAAVTNTAVTVIVYNAFSIALKAKMQLS